MVANFRIPVATAVERVRTCGARALDGTDERKEESVVASIDGPVRTFDQDLWSTHMQVLSRFPPSGRRFNSAVCVHGAFVIAALAGQRGIPALTTCPEWTWLTRSIGSEVLAGAAEVPSAGKRELNEAIIGSMDARARILNFLSVSFHPPSSAGAHLQQALAMSPCERRASRRRPATKVTFAAQRRRPSFFVACNPLKSPIPEMNLSAACGKRALSALEEGHHQISATPRRFCGQGFLRRMPARVIR